MVMLFGIPLFLPVEVAYLMLGFLVRRLLSALFAIWVVITVTFIFMHSIPGGPFQSEKAIPPAIKANIEARYKLDQPLHLQYIDYLSNVVRGDLGPSFKYRGQTVNGIIAARVSTIRIGSRIDPDIQILNHIGNPIIDTVVVEQIIDQPEK